MLSLDRQNNNKRIFKCFRFIGKIVKGYSNVRVTRKCYIIVYMVALSVLERKNPLQYLHIIYSFEKNMIQK